VSRFGNIFDTLANFVTGLGQPGIDASVATQYIFQELDRNTLENIYRGDWLGRKIVDSVADDMTREWRAWQAEQDQIEALEEVEKTIALQRKVREWIVKARLYGGAALVLGVDDGNDASEPIDLKKCGLGCLQYVVVLHRYELNAGPRIYDVSDPYYSRPAYYTVATPLHGFQGQPGQPGSPQFAGSTPYIAPPSPTTPPGALYGFWSNVIPFRRKQGNQATATLPTTPGLGMRPIHPSRVIELPGNALPDWRLAPLGAGWGDSVLQTVIDTMQDMTTVMRSISAMVSDGKLDVVKIPEMSERLDQPGYKGKLIERFTLSAQTKSVISALLLDKEEEWNRVETNFAGLPMILHEFITLISGASGIPVTRLFGQAQGRGLSGGSTGGGGEDDLRNYYDDCASKQKNDITPRLTLLDEVMKRSALGQDDPDIHSEWKPLWVMDDTAKAAVAYQKAQTTQIYVNLGIINEDVMREALVNQLIEDGTYPGLEGAIDEHGAEPEEPEDLGGYVPGGGGEPAQPAQPGSPNMEEQHSGGQPAAKVA